MALWANLHGAFIIGFVLIGVHLAGAVVNWVARDCRTNGRHAANQRMVLVALGIACSLASLLNPNGWKLPVQVIRYTRSPLMMGLTQEFLPPNFHDLGNLPFAIRVGRDLLMLFIVRPRLNATDGLLLIVWLAAFPAHGAQRAGFCAGGHTNPRGTLERVLERRLALLDPPSLPKPFRPLDLHQPNGRRAGPAGAGRNRDDSGLGQAAARSAANRCYAPNFPPISFPSPRLNSFAESPSAVHGEMFNDYAWGGYFTLAMPQRKIFFHSNALAYGEEVFREFLQVNNGQPGWEDVLKKYRVGWTILPVGHRLNRLLAQRADWILVYADPVAAVYGRRIP